MPRDMNFVNPAAENNNTRWSKPLDLEQLAAPAVRDESEIETVKRAGMRKFVYVGAEKQARETAEESTEYDFEAQFLSDSENVNDVADTDPEIDKMIKDRQRRLQKNLAKADAPDYTKTPLDEKRETSAAARWHTQATSERKSSFLTNVSSGFRTFLSRSGKPRPENNIPNRLNRLRKADQSSISMLTSTFRREVFKASTRNARHGQTSLRQAEDMTRLEDRSVLPYPPEVEDRSLHEADELEKNARVMSFIVPDEPSDEEDALVVKFPSLFDVEENDRQAVEDTSQDFDIPDCQNIQGDLLQNLAPTPLVRTSAGTAQSQPSTELNHIERVSSLSTCASPSSSGTSLIRKVSETPLSIADLIQHYDAPGSLRRSKHFDSSGTCSANLKLQTDYDIERVRAVFEIADLPDEPPLQRSEWSCQAQQTHAFRFAKACSSARITPVHGSTKSPLMSELTPLSNRTEDDAIVPDRSEEHFAMRSPTQNYRVARRLDTATAGFSMTSGLKPSVSPSPTPTSKGIKKQDCGGSVEKAASKNERRAVALRERDTNGERINLRDLFDSMDLMPKAMADSGSNRNTLTSTQSDAHTFREVLLPERNETAINHGNESGSWKMRARSKSFAPSTRAERAGEEGLGEGRRRATTEGRWGRRRRTVHPVQRQLKTFRNMISADDY